MTILGSGQPPFLERPHQSTLGVNRSCVGNCAASRGGGPAIFRIRRGRARLWTRSAARRVGGTPFRARTLFYCRRTELSRPARMCAPARASGEGRKPRKYSNKYRGEEAQMHGKQSGIQVARGFMRRIGRDKYELTSTAERHAS